ncbi:hypothetical protein P0W64_10835 [Tsukamurella sp. 8F]|uniref:hypothetical protein n=1 Tax=unclassified Tsukamurella TaxID=2633480 RepID=UPI0023B9EDD1|nr:MULTISPECIES: hypothetical protein [unclassified Tsukamurella]MDF0529962.1 hypothetical protein [Tsukamurella sp. 8J]MDF0587266.1 hypothetical protein [Tsukamurella sp. 8F]
MAISHALLIAGGALVGATLYLLVLPWSRRISFGRPLRGTAQIGLVTATATLVLANIVGPSVVPEYGWVDPIAIALAATVALAIPLHVGIARSERRNSPPPWRAFVVIGLTLLTGWVVLGLLDKTIRVIRGYGVVDDRGQLRVEVSGTSLTTTVLDDETIPLLAILLALLAVVAGIAVVRAATLAPDAHGFRGYAMLVCAGAGAHIIGAVAFDAYRPVGVVRLISAAQRTGDADLARLAVPLSQILAFGVLGFLGTTALLVAVSIGSSDGADGRRPPRSLVRRAPA